MKNNRMLRITVIVLLCLSAFIYFLQIAIFHDPSTTFFYIFAGRGNPDIRTMIGLFICPPLWLSICFSGYSLSCFSGYSLSAISLLHHPYVPDVPRLSVGFQGLFP